MITTPVAVSEIYCWCHNSDATITITSVSAIIINQAM